MYPGGVFSKNEYKWCSEALDTECKRFKVHKQQQKTDKSNTKMLPEFRATVKFKYIKELDIRLNNREPDEKITDCQLITNKFEKNDIADKDNLKNFLKEKFQINLKENEIDLLKQQIENHHKIYGSCEKQRGQKIFCDLSKALKLSTLNEKTHFKLYLFGKILSEKLELINSKNIIEISKSLNKNSCIGLLENEEVEDETGKDSFGLTKFNHCNEETKEWLELNNKDDKGNDKKRSKSLGTFSS